MGMVRKGNFIGRNIIKFRHRKNWTREAMLEQLRLNQADGKRLLRHAAICLVRPTQLGNGPLPNWADVKSFVSRAVRNCGYWRK
jgi:hypothetical protein